MLLIHEIANSFQMESLTMKLLSMPLTDLLNLFMNLGEMCHPCTFGSFQKFDAYFPPLPL